LGCREFPANFELIEDGQSIPESELKGTTDLGWMLYDMEFKGEQETGVYDEIKPKFFRAEMKDGVIDVAKQGKAGVKK
jgi:CRISPR-associated protein Cas5d